METIKEFLFLSCTYQFFSHLMRKKNLILHLLRYQKLWFCCLLLLTYTLKIIAFLDTPSVLIEPQWFNQSVDALFNECYRDVASYSTIFHFFMGIIIIRLMLSLLHLRLQILSLNCSLLREQQTLTFLIPWVFWLNKNNHLGSQ